MSTNSNYPMGVTDQDIDFYFGSNETTCENCKYLAEARIYTKDDDFLCCESFCLWYSKITELCDDCDSWVEWKEEE